MRRAGFTLVELLVVLMMMVILMGSAVALFSVIFRGQGVRQGAVLLSSALAEARIQAAKTRRMHFIRLFNKASDQNGSMQVYVDTNDNKTLDTATDQKVGTERALPKGVRIEWAGGVAVDAAGGTDSWIAFGPTGYVTYKEGTGIGPSEFEELSKTSSTTGDVRIIESSRNFRMLIDVDEIMGVVRKSHFFAP
jgi:prepilin-type N-terminal cleavage/methylation domain-containing protein